MIKEDLKNLLSSFTKEDYYKNVDFHIHSNMSDGKLSPVKIVQQAKKLNKKYISISDHNTLEAYISTNVLSNKEVIETKIVKAKKQEGKTLFDIIIDIIKDNNCDIKIID